MPPCLPRRTPVSRISRCASATGITVNTIIANARTDLPDLVAEIRRLNAELEKLTPKTPPSDDESRVAIAKGVSDLLRSHGHDPDAEAVFVKNSLMAEVVFHATGERVNVVKIKKFLTRISVPELAWHKRGVERGWIWRGALASHCAPAISLGKHRRGKGGREAGGPTATT